MVIPHMTHGISECNVLRTYVCISNASDGRTPLRAANPAEKDGQNVNADFVPMEPRR